MSRHRLAPCPCAREWLAAMVEEAMRRKPADAGPIWLVGWLLGEARMSIKEQDAIMKKLEEADQAGRGDVHDWTD